ncbi:HlyD family secretion protein [Pedobacter steynii]|uniref:HlyD family secretion protein n=1 Tax=Pedobacter steynii TaxID=430522 RepID=A0A1G9IYW9_9SPHI|nr:HlyD family efflux transporter periplasmic adaptor subunit [Pedobacter steynii]NQX38092.1 HlyD family efflux transporter periplasmic adaptor subunit [Pedobacter steynii]SDL30457.1 HlyD family secretion protein [Pedobacter steynii]
MDTVLQKKRWSFKRIALLGGAVLMVGLMASGYLLGSGKSRVKVELSNLVIADIKKGPFQEFIPVNGVVMPITSIYLDAAEGGRLEEKFVEDGAFLKKGDPILKLSNTDLELSLANQETAVFNLLTQMQISRNAAQQNTIGKLNQMADVESSWEEAERTYLMNKKLFDQKMIATQEFKKSQIAYNYQVRKKKLTAQILKQDSTLTKQELYQSAQSFQRTQNALAVMRKKVEDLTVRAPVSGQLTSLDAEIGQNKNKGERLGQIDVISGFKVRAEIDEHYISRIFPGLQAEFNFNNKKTLLRVKKIFTQVLKGKFQVDMEFVGETPEGIRRGQTLQVRLALSDATNALLLPRGGFYQKTGGNWIFKLSKDGKTAHRADLSIGRQNPDFYELKQGLVAGDRVIISGYEAYGEMQELVLKGD